MFVKRKRDREGLPLEQDSFLDIVANLVGILIILVVVIGSQIGVGMSRRPSAEVTAAQSRLAEIQQQQYRSGREALQRDSDHRDMAQNLTDQKTLTLQRQMERDLILRQVLMIEHVLENETRKLSSQQQQALSLKQAVAAKQQAAAAIEAEIEQLQYAVAEVEQEDEVKPEIIEHYPTPIAKTVFGEEVHFQLKDGYIVYAPLNELVQRLKATWETLASDLPPGQRMMETIGPIANFRLQYELQSETKTLPTQSGVIQRTVVSLVRFSLLPSAQNMGETVEVALQDGSEFERALAKYEPAKTTVSMWVYPENYGVFLDVRKKLIAKGFRVAVWPLTDDQKISGSPNGLRSSAQ